MRRKLFVWTFGAMFLTAWIGMIGVDPAMARRATKNDVDADGLSNRWEARLGTDPLDADTDDDGLDDGDEVADGTDPLDADSHDDGIEDDDDSAPCDVQADPTCNDNPDDDASPDDDADDAPSVG
jgi:hypothetical protein